MYLSKPSMLAVLILCCALILTSGCDEPASPSKRVFLSVDFQPGQILRYKFTSERKVITDWQSGKREAKSKQSSSESVEMVVAYEPIEVDPYGLTKVKATFESVKAVKTGTKSKAGNAVETLAGKSFTFSVRPNGKIEGMSELVGLLLKSSRAAFRSGRSSNVKEPDLLEDVIASQWYLWDPIASIEKPAKGLLPGHTWKSQLLVPTSMILHKGREVTYRLDEVRETEQGPVAVINSTYAMSDVKPEAPLPYEGSFRLAGKFGFFRSMFKGLSITSLEGDGQELYNLDAGRTDSYKQNYMVTLKPNAVPLPGTNPIIYLEQKNTMELLDQ